MLKITKG